MLKSNLLKSFFLILALFSAAALQAQDTASITGTVTDASGAVIPGVHVTLTNPATSANYEGITNQQGSYTIHQLRPGPGYTATFSRDGFQSVKISGIYLNVDATRTQNARLTVGNVVQTVAVSAANQDVTLNTTDATVGNNFQVQFLNDLPIANRDSPAALFTQQPGVTLDGAVTGARVDQDNVTLDGLDVNDNATGDFGTIVANAPVDSVQEFRGVTAGPLASAGEGGGAQYELVTRSGTNRFHGALVEYHRDTDLEANNWFNNNAGVPRPPLVRNQFGGDVGGPIWKNKAFFFFDYNGRRDTLSNLVTRVVPMTSFQNGTLNYIDSNGNTQAMGSAAVASKDPNHIGFDPALLSFTNKRYPAPNDFSGACDLQLYPPTYFCPDLVNTASYRFNAPFPYAENDFVLRLDYTLNSKMKLFAIGHATRTTGTQNPIQFPGDPQTYPFLDRSASWAIGHSWTIGPTMLNQFEYGETYEDFAFPNTYNPPGINQFETFGGNGTGGAVLSAPYGRAINAQDRTYPVPVIRDDFSWEKGQHSITMGGSFKWISPRSNTILDYNQPVLGISGATPTLDSSMRPADLGSGEATALYDNAFALALGVYTQVTATYNYDAQGNPLPQATGSRQDFRYYETELYVGDTWKVSPSLTLSYGLRWQDYTVPYERNGLESVAQIGTPGGTTQSVQNSTFNSYFGARVAQSVSGVAGNLAVPLFDYVLGGKANHAAGFYKNSFTDFAPRFAFAYSPGFDRKSVFSGGAGIIYDHTVVNAINYQQSQYDYLFQSSSTNDLGVAGNPRASVISDPRFAGITTAVPPPAPPPSVARPYYPFVTGSGAGAVPGGLANGQAFNETIDPAFKTPYSIQYNFGWQHEFPQGYLLRATYVGRLGRRLMAQADANQLIDFPDKASGQMMSQAFRNISVEARNGQPITAQPWFEDILPANWGVNQGYANNSEAVVGELGAYVPRGDFADSMEGLSYLGVLPPNVGMAAQFSENTMYTNKGFSSYNGLLLTLHKNAGYGLQFDMNYTWSHSIDNVSLTANTPALAGYGFICDVLRPRECRGPSDFDVTNILNGNFIYELPFGRGRSFASGISPWLNEAVGGWEISGLPSWHTGLPYFGQSEAFVAGYSNNAPAILTGNITDMKAKLHGGRGGPLYAYANPSAAIADYTGPLGFTIGSRNNLRGPGYFDLDLGLGKTFPIWENLHLKFRADAFNAFNHPNFAVPCSDITNSSCVFGTISSTVSTLDVPFSGGNRARVLQGALRLEF